ncbi:MAG: PilZ domain-containing protein [Planctomycetota bacterium]
MLTTTEVDSYSPISEAEIALLLQAGPTVGDDRPIPPSLHQIDKACCRACGVVLPHNAPVAGCETEIVDCPACGDASKVLKGSESPTDDDDSGERIKAGTSRSMLERLVGELTRTADGTPPVMESRRHVRYPASRVVTAIAVDRQGRPHGDTLVLTLCDISLGGAGFTSMVPVETPWLLVQFVTRLGVTSAPSRVVWQHTEGRVTRFGVEFITLA